MKTNNIGLRLDDIELGRLDRLARAEGIGRQDLLRMLLARAEQLLPRPKAGT